MPSRAQKSHRFLRPGLHISRRLAAGEEAAAPATRLGEAEDWVLGAHGTYLVGGFNPLKQTLVNWDYFSQICTENKKVS